MNRRITSGFAVLLAWALPAVPARAQVICGQTITQSVTLSSDLDCSLHNGLVIGADNVTIDLGGHILQGDLDDDRATVGISDSGYRGLTVTNGTIVGFPKGIVINGADNVVITQVTLYHNPLQALDAPHIRVERNTATGGAIQILGEGALIDHNAVTATGTPYGISATGAGVRVEDNTVTGTSGGGIFTGADPSNSTMVLRNTASDNRAGDGINVSTGASVANNTANDNRLYGIEASQGVIDGGGNVATGNGWGIPNRNPGDPECVNIDCFAQLSTTTKPSCIPITVCLKGPPGGMCPPACTNGSGAHDAPTTAQIARRQANRFLLDHYRGWRQAHRRRLTCRPALADRSQWQCVGTWRSAGKQRRRALVVTATRASTR
jgi:hypothetical protein